MTVLSPGMFASFSQAGAARLASPARPSVDQAPGRLGAQQGGMRLTEALLTGPWHACAFFPTGAAEYRVLLPFAHACAVHGDRCVQFVNPAQMQERVQRLAEAGITISHGPAPQQVEVHAWDDGSLRPGGLSPEEMLALMERTTQIGRVFGRTRVWGTMEWAAEQLSGGDALVEFESRLNPMLDKGNDIVICAYQQGRHSASLVMDILRTHPMILVGDELKINPLYVPTDRFLEDLRQRRAPRPGLRSVDPDPPF